MIEQDTIKLLKECAAGLKMGLSSIDEVQEYVSSETLAKHLDDCKNAHIAMQKEIQQLLAEYNDDGKEPNPMAKSMSWVKTNVKLGLDDSDKTIADLMTDGCNMGVKSLSRYLNQYKAADEKSKDISKRLIAQEDTLAKNIRQFL